MFRLFLVILFIIVMNMMSTSVWASCDTGGVGSVDCNVPAGTKFCTDNGSGGEICFTADGNCGAFVCNCTNVGEAHNCGGGGPITPTCVPDIYNEGLLNISCSSKKARGLLAVHDNCNGDYAAGGQLWINRWTTKPNYYKMFNGGQWTPKEICATVWPPVLCNVCGSASGGGDPWDHIGDSPPSGVTPQNARQCFFGFIDTLPDSIINDGVSNYAWITADQTMPNSAGLTSDQTFTCPLCTPTAPAAPSLITPADGGTSSSLGVSMNVTPNGWGNVCSSTKKYIFYAAPVPTGNTVAINDTNRKCTRDEPSRSCLYDGLSYGTRYCWTAITNNGNLNSVPANAFCFTTVDIPGWWQAVGGGDIYGVNVQSIIPDTATNKFIILN